MLELSNNNMKSSYLENSMKQQNYKHRDRFDTGVIPFQNPPPGAYRTKSMFDPTSKGKSMGTSRELMKGGSILKYLNNFPGPGRYESQSSLGNIKYSFRSKVGGECNLIYIKWQVSKEMM